MQGLGRMRAIERERKYRAYQTALHERRRKNGHVPSFTRQQERAQARAEMKKHCVTPAERGRQVMELWNAKPEWKDYP